jgi:dTDP-4-dehydrorhamnose reductase
MRIAIIGARGQLGTALRETLSGDVVPLDRSQLDLGDAKSIQSCLSAVKPDLVVNAAAHNFVDRAEDEPELALAVNSLGPRNIACFCGTRDLPLVHISTDHVFSGVVDLQDKQWFRDMPYREFDPPQPPSAYGMSKLAGERFVQLHCARHFVLRTCGLYGRAESAGKGNFVQTMLRLAGERDELRVVNDQRCTPTSAADLAAWIAALIRTDAYGLYHATNSGSCTWYEFATEIFRIADRRVKVVPITSAEFGAKAGRPPFSVLDCAKLQRVTGLTFRSWQEALAEYVGERCRG